VCKFCFYYIMLDPYLCSSFLPWYTIWLEKEKNVIIINRQKNSCLYVWDWENKKKSEKARAFRLLVIQIDRKKNMSEAPPPSSLENNETSSSWWFDSLFSKTNTQSVTRNRSNCISNTTSSSGDRWSRLRQFFNLPDFISSINTGDTFQSSVSHFG
jgi:hypothetical protein